MPIFGLFFVNETHQEINTGRNSLTTGEVTANSGKKIARMAVNFVLGLPFGSAVRILGPLGLPFGSAVRARLTVRRRYRITEAARPPTNPLSLAAILSDLVLILWELF